ncbi:MAG: hypothetical protein EOM03_16680 [Clostridia bacterium]|nr:hypothetical protein [Clostridia bacterium]
MSDLKTDMVVESIDHHGKFTQEQAFALLSARLEHARKEHPVFATHNREAAHVIDCELNELLYAVAHEGPDRILDEALDVAATAMRLVMGEVHE